MLVSTLYIICALNFTSYVATRQNKLAFAAIDMVKLKTKYSSLFADYHPAKSALRDPRFTYYYKSKNLSGKFDIIGFGKKFNKVGFVYIGKEKRKPPAFIELEFSKGCKTRIYTTCGRKRSKPVYTADGIPINQ